MNTLTLLFLQILILSHPVHYSVLNIEHLEQDKQLSVSLRLMHDDFFMLAFHRYGDRMDSSAIAELAYSDAYIQNYLNKMLFIVVNSNDTLRIQGLNRKNEGDNMWIYFNVPVQGKISQIHITNYLLMDIFEDQTNLVILQVHGQEKAYRMGIQCTEVEFSSDKYSNDNK